MPVQLAQRQAGHLEAELSARLARLTLEQKVRLLTAATFWSLAAEPAIGLRQVVTSDGPAGVRGQFWDSRDPSANLPSPTALAASWDTARVERLGRLLAAEARRKQVDLLLAPTVNLQRTPYAGRHFEYYSEDPLLTGRIGTAFVTGVQSGGVGATLKHFVANDSETDRRTLDARIDERVLREIYLAPFETIIADAAPWAVLAAYNSVNGHPMAESPMLAEVLRGEWGFDGVVMSDWFAVNSTEAPCEAGLDLAMPGPDGSRGAALVSAVRAGRVAERTVDDLARRVLRLAARAGALDGLPGAVAEPAAADHDIAGTLREAAAAGFVLAHNDGVLPLNRARLKRVAVIGPNAIACRTVGGGSATVYPPYTVSPVAGLCAALGDGAEVTYHAGVRAFSRARPAEGPWLRHPGDPSSRESHQNGEAGAIEVRFLTGDGTVLAAERRASGHFMWLGGFGPGVPAEKVVYIEARTRLIAPESGEYTIGASGIGAYRLSVDGAVVFDAELRLPAEADDAERLMAPPQRLHKLCLAAGTEVRIGLRHDIRTALDFGTAFQLNLELPYGTDDEEIATAAALAADADAVVVVVGTTPEVESEGFDRKDLTLPGRQGDLVRRVAAANPRTVVVVNAGAPVLLPWADEVAAVLLAWFPGQEFGNALADVLLGDAEPGGRLPVTWPRSADGLPTVQPAADGTLRYAEGLFVGYRGDGLPGYEPLYPFGHGLGYTTWRYGNPSAPTLVAAAQDVTVQVPVENTGDRTGREVVQVYLARPDSAVPRPARWLAGFAGVTLPTGGAATVEVTVPGRAFAHWDADASGWCTERGPFTVYAASSSRCLHSATTVTVR